MAALAKLGIGIAATLLGFCLGLLGAYLMGYTEKEVVMPSGFGAAAALGIAGLWVDGRFRPKLPRSYQRLWIIVAILAAFSMVVFVARMIS